MILSAVNTLSKSWDEGDYFTELAALLISLRKVNQFLRKSMTYERQMSQPDPTLFRPTPFQLRWYLSINISFELPASFQYPVYQILRLTVIAQVTKGSSTFKYFILFQCTDKSSCIFLLPSIAAVYQINTKCDVFKVRLLCKKYLKYTQ